MLHRPKRFAHAVRAAFGAELPLIRPATFRARFPLSDIWSTADHLARLRAIARRGTQGIELLAKANPRIEACLADLKAQAIPVVTAMSERLGVDRSNRTLLDQGKVGFVIHLNYRQEPRHVARHCAGHDRRIKPHTQIERSAISIACPTNL